MNPLINLIARLELMLEQADAALQEERKKSEELVKERDELKKLLEAKGGEN